MDKKEKRKPGKTAFFSIGAKLVIIISIIVLLSLGSITALVSWLVREDLRILAEENNFEMNRRSAMEAEYIIGKMHTDSLVLIKTLNAVGPQSDIAQEIIEFFFDQNAQVAALLFTFQGAEDELLVNRRLFGSGNRSLPCRHLP